MHGDHCNACEYVFDAVVELGDQQVLALLGLLAPRDIAGQALEAYDASSRVEFCPRRLLEPHFLPVRANETKGDRVGRAVDADLVDERLETCAVVQMNAREELGGGESMLWIKAEDLRSIRAALRQAAAGIPLEGRHRPGRQRFLQPRLALLEHGLMVTPLSEQRRKNICA